MNLFESRISEYIDSRCLVFKFDENIGVRPANLARTSTLQAISLSCLDATLRRSSKDHCVDWVNIYPASWSFATLWLRVSVCLERHEAPTGVNDFQASDDGEFVPLAFCTFVFSGKAQSEIDTFSKIIPEYSHKQGTKSSVDWFFLKILTRSCGCKRT